MPGCIGDPLEGAYRRFRPTTLKPGDVALIGAETLGELLLALIAPLQAGAAGSAHCSA